MLPAYVRMTYQGVTGLDLATSSASMNALFVISIYFGDLPNELVDELEKNMKIKVNNLIIYSLTTEQFKDLDAGLKKIRNDKRKVLTYIVSAEFPLNLNSEVRYVPFDALNFNIEVKL